MCVESSLGFFKEGGEDFTAPAHRGELDAIVRPCKRALGDGNFHGGIAGVLSGQLGHLLVHRNRVAVGRADLSSGQPDVDAVVVVAQAAGVVQSTDGSDGVPIFFERFQRA